MLGKDVRSVQNLATLRSDVAHTRVEDAKRGESGRVVLCEVDQVEASKALEAEHDHEEPSEVVLGGLGKVVGKELVGEEKEEDVKEGIHHLHEPHGVRDREIGLLGSDESTDDAEISHIREEHAPFGVSWKGFGSDHHGCREIVPHFCKLVLVLRQNPQFSFP